LKNSLNLKCILFKCMRIAINGRSILLSQRTGIGRYTYHLLDSLGKIDQANEYILYAPKRLFDFKRRLPDFSRYKNFKNRIDCFHQGVGKSDIYHLPSPDAIGPYQGKLVVTIHDLIYKTYPQAHTAQAIEQTEKHMQSIVTKADRIICISDNTRRDLHASFHLPLEKTCVVYNGVDHQTFYPLSPQERLDAGGQLKELGIDKPYILYVGTIEPRKNLTGLLESFALLKSKKIFQGKLVVVGMKGWMLENIGEMIKQLGIEQDVVFTGFISDAQLRLLYNMTEVFVFPSFYEGFGFPILEAFCCGAAVITSNNSSCAEIASDAALTIDPKDPKEMASAMERVLTDKNINGSIRQAGLKRAKEFSFLTTAQNTLDVYRRVII
jgi:glycosyltransferase involved in cell wall biosynthesis